MSRSASVLPPLSASDQTARADRVELKVDDLRLLFHALDPLPYGQRDLDPEVEAFVVEGANEVGPGRVAEIRIHAPAQAAGRDQLQVEGAVRAYFARRAGITARQHRNLLRRGRMSLVVGLAVLAGSSVAGRLAMQIPPGPFGVFLAEGLVIFGWVANWRPIEIFLYDWWPLLRLRRLYTRLSQCRVTVVTDRSD